jgi:hypothetical protein
MVFGELVMRVGLRRKRVAVVVVVVVGESWVLWIADG